ncbi:hypothetical protein MBLNU459_g6483t2 [Dothideomycetes sp. NU459]
MASLPRTPLFEEISRNDPKSIAVVHSLSGRTFSYGCLLRDVAAAKERLAESAGKNVKDMTGERIAFLVENSYDYVVTLLSVLGSNAIAVPLSPAFPASELRYILNHSEALMLLSSSKFADKAAEVLQDGLDFKPVSASLEKIAEGDRGDGKVTLEETDSASDQGGLMLYTSGTTSRPKGVLIPRSTLYAQEKSIGEAWNYSPSDRFLHVLPLHHIHGTMNALLAVLVAGGSIEFMFPFNVDHVWNRLAAPFMPSQSEKKTPITVFTVVPTVYNRLLQSHKTLSPEMQTAIKQALKPEHLRLNISGSAALPTPTKKAWTELSGGNILLERFGMTEVGMALSCGLAWEDRVDGSVGWPMPSVSARLVDTDTHEVIEEGQEFDANGKERQGEIQLKGPTIFKEYWRNPAATASEFTSDGYFKTGDIAVRRPVPSAGSGASGAWAKGPMYFIHGRKSADIIKTGGEKVSALEIEREILSLSAIAECAVVALPSEAWGQKVAAVIVLSEEGRTAGRGGKPFGAMDLRRALKDRLVAYKIPQDLKVVDTIPRNAMGKINKKELVKQVFGDPDLIRRRSINLKLEKEAAKKSESK